ncbi:MAG: flagellar motor protein [Anaerolineae bacterium]|nr:flagellar motor protein [Anaerolineae bacterium]MDW8099699.1 flagellar motor protein [Anaerolineae bacterium]
MNIGTILGLLVGIGCILASVVVEGGALIALVNLPGALIVFGGTIGATLVNFPLALIQALPKMVIRTITGGPHHQVEELVSQLVSLADKARRQGLLSLEEEEQNITDPFLKKGIMLVVDGVDPVEIRHILETDTQLMAERHAHGYGVLEAMGGYAPTMGVLGAVLGLINVLSHLEESSHLGKGIATAFVATMYGVGVANLVFLPLAGKLKAHSQEEVLLRKIMTEGILAIQAGDNPHIIREKLEAYLSPSLRGRAEPTPARAVAEGA